MDSKLEQCHLDLVKQHNNKVQTLSDLHGWLAKKQEGEAKFITSCLINDVLSHVVDWNAFLATRKLFEKHGAFIKQHVGEDPLHFIHIRNKLSFIVPISNVGKEEDVVKIKYSFYAWTLWNQTSNKSKMYIPLPAIIQYCTKNDLDIEVFMKHIRKHHTFKYAYIFEDLFEAEKTIQRCLDNAKIVCNIYITQQENPNRKQTSKASSPANVLDDKQQQTIKSMMGNNYAVLQGGAGVGKTTTVSYLIEEIMNQCPQNRIFCLAFTHKAKRCITEKLVKSGVMKDKDPDNSDSGIKISTIHSFIASFKTETIPPCYILIDESSMIDIELLASLCNLLLTNCSKYQIGFVGDMMQLPPIGRGEFYRFLVNKLTNENKANILTKCYRTDKKDLFDAYESVRAGKFPRSSENVKVLSLSSDKEINSHVGKIIYDYCSKDASALKDKVQFIAWQNKDVFKINGWVQSALLKHKKIGPESFRQYYVGDKVIYRGENTPLVTNATIGKVSAVTSKSVTIVWDDQSGTTSTITNDKINTINLAYALTVHSLQGSECENVIIACFEVGKMKHCLDRRFLYTAISRGKESVTVLTTPDIEAFLFEPIKPLPLTGLKV